MTHKIKICANCDHNKVCSHRKYGFQCEDFKEEKKVMTFEDVKRIRQNPTFEDCDNKELSKLIDIALEKQIPKKPKIKELTIGYLNGEEIKGSYYHCHCCKSFLGLDAKIYKFCPRCGQALDWSDTK